jgi:hypothetical protein
MRSIKCKGLLTRYEVGSSSRGGSGSVQSTDPLDSLSRLRTRYPPLVTTLPCRMFKTFDPVSQLSNFIAQRFERVVYSAMRIIVASNVMPGA